MGEHYSCTIEIDREESIAPGLTMDVIPIYFVYGLAFFSMGLAMMLESRRSPLLAEARVLRPLAFFGFVHGSHEWLEMALLARDWLGLPTPALVPFVRLSLLVISFTSLIVFGLRVLRPQEERLTLVLFYPALTLFCLYLAVVVLTGLKNESGLSFWTEHADVLARYLLAVPGAALAALALNRQSNGARAAGRAALVWPLRFAAWGFAVYSLTQLFVPPHGMFLAPWVNTQAFLAWFGIPIQLVRAVLAVSITICLVRASQVVELERDNLFLSAQQARLKALEQLHHELVEREALRRELLRHTVIAQEDERARIARELHDETAQFLTALSLNLATLENSLPMKPEVGELIGRLLALNRQMSQGIYRMVHDLRPAQLDDLGLVPALHHLAKEERRRSGLEIDLQVSGPRQRLDSLVETVFFRVAQEALANVVRHARCQQAIVQLHFDPRQVNLRVIDQGAGFDVHRRQTPPRGWGLAGMRERAESIGGQFYLTSAPGRGTQVEVVVPLIQPEQPEIEEYSHEYHPFDVGR